MGRILGFLVGVQIATGATGQSMKPAEPADIVAGVQSCMAATSEPAVDAAAIEADGWEALSLSADGKPHETSMAFYSRGKILLTFDREASVPLCIITAKLSGTDRYPQVFTAMNSALEVRGVTNPGETNTFYWLPKEHLIQLLATGSSKEPALRIAVGYRKKS